MNQQTTTAVVLSRTDYGEADRILTVLTPEYGKLRLMARGVRKVKSKLAGGIELFSVSHITFIRGRSEICTLVSARLIEHYGSILVDIRRVQLGYELIKLLNKITEDNSEPGYFELLVQTFQALNDLSVDEQLIRLWFYTQLLRLGGHMPNLYTESSGVKLVADRDYQFSFDSMSFAPDVHGPFTADHVKFLRLMFGGNQPKALQHIQGSNDLLSVVRPIIQTMLNTFVRI